MTPEEFYEYIEELATKHLLINHSNNEKHYFRGELEEFYMDLRNRVNFPALIAESYEIPFENDAKIRESSFIIAANYHEVKNWSEIYSAMSLCERIGDEVLRKMIDDGDNGNICGTVTPIIAIPIINEQHLYCGMRYTFRISSAFETDPDEDMWRQ